MLTGTPNLLARQEVALFLDFEHDNPKMIFYKGLGVVNVFFYSDSFSRLTPTILHVGKHFLPVKWCVKRERKCVVKCAKNEICFTAVSWITSPYIVFGLKYVRISELKSILAARAFEVCIQVLLLMKWSSYFLHFLILNMFHSRYSIKADT